MGGGVVTDGVRVGVGRIGEPDARAEEGDVLAAAGEDVPGGETEASGREEGPVEVDLDPDRGQDEGPLAGVGVGSL